MNSEHESGSSYRGWEYVRLGEYHRRLNLNWSYAPTYLRKVSLVKDRIRSGPRGVRILDAGAGEGVIVDELRIEGWDIVGLDLNYESESVIRGNVLEIPFPDDSFDFVLLLDTLEHLAFKDQRKCLQEMRRVLKPRGQLLLSVPNLLHLNSRFRGFFKGSLDRSDSEINHVGERPYSEYRNLLVKNGFAIEKVIGITLTIPIVYRRFICRFPARLRWLHDLFEPLASSLPSLTLVALFTCSPRHKFSAPTLESPLRASVVIPTFGRGESLAGTLESVLNQDFDSEEFEVIVVDNDPKRSVKEVVDEIRESLDRDIRLIKEPKTGLHHARHAGAKAARGKILAYVDDDVIVPPGWLEALTAAFDSPRVGIVGGRVLPRWEIEPPEWIDQVPSYFFSLSDLGDETKPVEGGHVHGCNMAVRRDVLFQVGGFNPDSIGTEVFPLLRGDGEGGLQNKVIEANYLSIYEPKAFLWHRIPQSRVTKKAIIERAAKEGLSRSFAHLRKRADRNHFLFRSTVKGILALLRGITGWMSSLFFSRKRLSRKVDGTMWFAYARQHFRVLLSPKTKRAVLQESFLDLEP